MRAFLTTLHTMSWQTAIGPRDYLWAYIRLSILMLMGMGMLAFLVGGSALLVTQMAWPEPLLWVPLAVFGFIGIAGMVWGLLAHLKISMNRIHDFGYKARYIIPAYFALLVLLEAGGTWLITRTLAMEGTLSGTGVFLKACFGIISLLAPYLLAFEKGPATIPFERTDVLTTPWAWWRTAIVVVWVGLLLVSTLPPLVQLLMLI